MNVLDLIISYYNSLGIYFDNNTNDCVYVNSYHQQQSAPPLRRRRKRNAKRNSGGSNPSINKALEASNMKKEFGTKIGKENKMDSENSKGLGDNAECVTEPPMVVKKDNHKGLTSKEAIQCLSKGQRRRLRLRLKKEAELKAKEAVRIKKIQRYSENVCENHKQAQVSYTTRASTSNALKKEDEIEQASKDRFSVKDPCTPEFLNAMANCFKSEIKLMQLRLEVTDTLNSNDNAHDMIIAKISVDNTETIANHVFEIIRNDLVGWIGAYQRDGLDTPIFHAIENNTCHIKVICENDYAYNCLEQCINEISGLISIGSLQLFRQPAVTPVIYCFDFIYKGIVHDANLFLTQLHLHKPKLYTENWVVASHDVCVEESLTYFIFLVDERSALALNFQYSRSFLVCMQTVKFRYRGMVTEKILN